MAFPTAVPSKTIFPGLYRLKADLNLYDLGRTGDYHSTARALQGTILFLYEAWTSSSPTGGSIEVVRVLHEEKTYTMLFSTEFLLPLLEKLTSPDLVSEEKQ